jgi:protein-disulfide isomerase
MSGSTCPVCSQACTSSRNAEEHAWREHSACHLCGTEIDSNDKPDLFEHWLTTHSETLTDKQRKKAESKAELSPTSSLQTRLQNISRRRVLEGGVIVGALGFLGAGLSTLRSGAGVGGTDAAAGIVENAQVPADATQHSYAIMGSSNSDAIIDYIGSWKCPVCARFSQGFLRTLVDDYVQPGDVQIRFRNLAYINGDYFLGRDAPAAGHAGLAVWNTAPDAYWQFHEYVFRNQPPEREQWATADRLAEFAKAAGVSATDEIKTAVETNQYEAELQETAKLASRVQASGTPTLVVDGKAISPGQRKRTRSAIEAAIDD